MSNETITEAKRAKKDEFYTQFNDIQNEVSAYLEYNPEIYKDKTILLPCDDPAQSNFTKFFAQNFERFGLKKLISTSYAPYRKIEKYGLQGDLFDEPQKKFKKTKEEEFGKVFILDSDITGDGKIDIDDLHWSYLNGDGDFNSPEVGNYCDEADFIITNPPFSLFREFFEWLRVRNKKFLILSNINNVIYKDLFPLIKEEKVWLGKGFKGAAKFSIPKALIDEYEEKDSYDKSTGLVQFGNMCWLTNLEHGKRHEPLDLMSMEDNIKFNKKLQKKPHCYQQYLNYDAIEITDVDAIPADYNGVMGVPVSFLEKHCHEQYEILGMPENMDLYGLRTKKFTPEECQKAFYQKNGKKGTYDLNARAVVMKDKIPTATYARILIRKKSEWIQN